MLSFEPKQVEEIVRTVGDAVKERSAEVHELTLKNDPEHTIDFATEVDLFAERLLVDQLHEVEPTATFLAEEEHSGGAVEHGAMWVIDPIDGTNNFFNGSPIYGVNVAYVMDGHTHAAWTYLPAMNEMYTAVRGGGAYANGEILRVADRALPMSMIGMCVQPRILDKVEQTPWFELFGRVRAMRIYGCFSADLAWTAAGKLDGVLGAGLPWDVMPGMLLVEEAGGVARTLDGGHRDPLTVAQMICGPSHIVQSVLACFGIEQEMENSQL